MQRNTTLKNQSKSFCGGRIAQAVFERWFLPRWRGSGIKIRYWDGNEVTVDGAPNVATVHVQSPSVLWGILRNPSLGFGQAYVDGHLKVEGDLLRLLQCAFSALNWDSGQPTKSWIHRCQRFFPRRMPRATAEANARFHYQIGNEFFRLWLDPSMAYSCAYFRTEQDDLATAQAQKHELICRKLDLNAGDTVLDVGCGWGGLLFHAIEHYDVRAVGVTPCYAQASYIEQEAKRRGVADRLSLQVTDWRAVKGAYDRVVSVGMFEHVGQHHGREFFLKWHDWLKPGGVSLLHTIGAMNQLESDVWIAQNIFPGGYLPSLSELGEHAATANLMVADAENLWRHYPLTLGAWSNNFASAWDAIRAMKGERFVRKWWLWLNMANASFRSGRLLVWQMILTRGKWHQQPLTRDVWMLPELESPRCAIEFGYGNAELV